MSIDKRLYEEKLKKNSADSYSMYLAKNGIRSRDDYLDSVAAAGAAKELSEIKNNGMSDSLSAAGLSKSGYSDYLKSENEKTYISAIQKAEREQAVSEYKNTSGYEKYLSDYEKIQNEISKSFIESFGKGDSFDFEKAYAKAVEAGLNNSFAFYAATKGVNAAVKNTVDRAVAFAKLNNLSAYRAKQYAKQLGLPERYAKRYIRKYQISIIMKKNITRI